MDSPSFLKARGIVMAESFRHCSLHITHKNAIQQEGGDMAKLVLGAFEDLEQADQVIKELGKAGVPDKDFSLVANADEATTTAWVTEDSFVVGGVVGGLAGLGLGALMVTSTLRPGVAPLLIGFCWIIFSAVACGAAGSIIGALLSTAIPRNLSRHEETPPTTFGSALLGVEDTNASEDEIRNSFAKYGAGQVATVQHGATAAKLISAPQ
jgi:hypothetical protein